MKMPDIQVRSQVSLDELLNGMAQLETPELEHFIAQALTLRARRIAPSLRHGETRLLQKKSIAGCRPLSSNDTISSPLGGVRKH
jgi:hypothetical protein